MYGSKQPSIDQKGSLEFVAEQNADVEPVNHRQKRINFISKQTFYFAM